MMMLIRCTNARPTLITFIIPTMLLPDIISFRLIALGTRVTFDIYFYFSSIIFDIW